MQSHRQIVELEYARVQEPHWQQLQDWRSQSTNRVKNFNRDQSRIALRAESEKEWTDADQLHYFDGRKF